ncbi:MAG: tetratricopeptide repeat protein [Mycobacterium leprae]
MDGDLDSTLIQKADSLYGQGQLQEALQAYTDALNENPSLAWAFSRIGAIHAQLGDDRQAEEALLKALAIDPHLAQAHSNLGNIFYARGEYAEALAKYREAVTLNPDNPVFHQNMHAVYKKLGKLSEAVRELKQADRLSRSQARAESKAAYEGMKTKLKGRAGCFGTVAVMLILIGVLVVFAI